MRETSFTPTL